MNEGEVNIRPFRTADLGPLVRLYTESVHTLAADAYTAEQRNAWAPLPPDLGQWQQRLGRLQTRVAERDGELAGFLSYEQNGHLVLLYTSPRFARRGIASGLYWRVERTLVAMGIPEFFTEASLVARPFFARHGFRVTEEQTVFRNGVSFRRYAMAKSAGSPGNLWRPRTGPPRSIIPAARRDRHRGPPRRRGEGPPGVIVGARGPARGTRGGLSEADFSPRPPTARRLAEPRRRTPSPLRVVFSVPTCAHSGRPRDCRRPARIGYCRSVLAQGCAPAGCKAFRGTPRDGEIDVTTMLKARTGGAQGLRRWRQQHPGLGNRDWSGADGPRRELQTAACHRA